MSRCTQPNPSATFHVKRTWAASLVSAPQPTHMVFHSHFVDIRSDRSAGARSTSRVARVCPRERRLPDRRVGFTVSGPACRILKGLVEWEIHAGPADHPRRVQNGPTHAAGVGRLRIRVPPSFAALVRIWRCHVHVEHGGFHVEHQGLDRAASRGQAQTLADERPPSRSSPRHSNRAPSASNGRPGNSGFTEVVDPQLGLSRAPPTPLRICCGGGRL
jgi:hypothetical protein